MTSPSLILESSKPRSRVRTALKIFVILLCIVLLAAVLGLLWFRSAAHAALPQLDGTVMLEGLQQPVSVIRNAQGVPQIRAASMEDLCFAQGYVTAQDRLWGMDIYRRYAAGELSAALGSAYVETDKYQRTLGLRQVAETATAALTPRDRQYLEAYARGVNAYIREHKNSLPLEFRVARYFPRAWTVEDSFLVGAALTEALNHGYYKGELAREAILNKVGPELTADLYVNSSFRDVPPGTDGTEITGGEEVPAPEGDNGTANEPRRRHRRAAVDMPPLPEEPLQAGSNNWVLSGAHTTTGRPLLSNDMHLSHSIPNVWYEAHLTSGDFDVVGVTLPGVPFVIVGHNQRIAWGVTNLGADVEDTFVETFNNRREYQTPTGWQHPTVRHETIHVKHGRDVEMDVTVTRHGPILTPVLKNETRMIALQSANFDPRRPMQFPFFELNSAKNWQEFTAALSKLPAPSLNFVYADVDGHIGYQATGAIPIRAAGDGSIPSNGADASHDWTGYIPFEKLPSVYDPPSGVLATANSRITPDGYPYSLATEWVAPYRTERIYRVLHTDRKFSPADMLELQTDVYSSVDRFLAQRFVYAIDHASKPSDRARKAAEIMRNWDGRMTRDSAAATVAQVSRQKLQKMLLDAKLGDDAKLYKWWMSEVWLENVVLLQPARWLPPQYQNYAELLTAAVEQAVSDTKTPHNLESWHFGDQFPIELTHPIFGKMPFLRRFAGPGVQPQSGNGNTVKQVGRSFGPSERMTVDLSNLDDVTLNIVNGESGNLFSPYFNDQWSAWYNGTTFPLPFTQSEVEKTKSHELTLMPTK